MSFSGDEEKLIDSVVSVLDSGREKFTFQEVQLQSEIRYKDIIIDLNHREIIRDNKKIELTYTEFEILHPAPNSNGQNPTDEGSGSFQQRLPAEWDSCRS